MPATTECADCTPDKRCKYPGRCACCGAPHSGEGYDICLNCGWERDWRVENEPDPKWDWYGPNHMSLNAYRDRWTKRGKPFWGAWVLEDGEHLELHLLDPFSRGIIEARRNEGRDT